MGHIKLWDSLLNCPKTHRLSDRGFRVWIKALLTALRNGGRNGELPSRETLEFHLRMSWAEIEPALDELHRCGMLDPCPDNEIGGIPWRIHDWDEWQRPKDPKAAERQARWRANQALRNAQHNGLHNDRNNGEEGKKEEEKKIPPLIPQKPSANGKPKKEPFVLPDWVPADAWEGFIEMRSRTKFPLVTDRAKRGIINELDELRRLGHDCGKVLDRSTANGYRGVFPLPADQRSAGKPQEEPIKYHVAPPDSPYRAIEREGREALRAILGGQGGPAAPAEPGGGDGRPRVVLA